MFQVRAAARGGKGGAAHRGPPPTPAAAAALPGAALTSPRQAAASPAPTSCVWTNFPLAIGFSGDTASQVRPSPGPPSFILFLPGKLGYLPTLEMGALRQFLIFKRNSSCNAFSAYMHT